MAALVIAGRPVARADLTASVGIGRSTLGPLLSRLASDDLGIKGPVHRQVDVRRGLIEIDRAVVASDVAELRQLLDGPRNKTAVLKMIELGALDAPADLGLVADHPFSIKLVAELQSLRSRTARAIAWYVLAGSDSSGSLLEQIPEPDPMMAELWLAKLDRMAAGDGIETARRSLDRVGSQLGELASGNGVPVQDMARLIIETANIRPSLAESRPTADDQRRATAILDGLNKSDARVLMAHDPGIEPESVTALLRPMRGHAPGTIGAWASSGSTAAATLDQLIRPIVAMQIRRPGCDFPARLIATLLAVSDGERLEPESTSRWFARDVTATVQAWAGGEQPVVVIGRPAARSADLDRLLGDLLRLDRGLRLVLLHAEPDQALTDDTGRTRFEGFSCALLDMPRSTYEDYPWRSIEAPSGHLPEELDQAQLLRMAPVVALATDEDGRIHRPLAAHLLDAVGSTIDPHRLLDVIAAQDHVRPDDSHSNGASSRPPAGATPPGEFGWLGAEGLRWLIAGRLHRDADVSLLRLLIERIGRQHLPAGLCAELISLASVSVSHGDLGRGTGLLDLAVSTAETTRAEADALAQRGDCHRDGGDWVAAAADYRKAMSLSVDDGDELRIADLALRMARLTWDPALGEEVDGLLRVSLDRLDPTEVVWRARLQLCLAGGSFQDGSADGGRLDSAEVEAALSAAMTSFDPGARAWGLIHARKATLGVAPVAQSVQWAEAIVDNGQMDIAVLAHGHQALFVDNIRRGDWSGARRSVQRLGQLAMTPVSAEQRFSALVARVCWELVSDQVDAADESLSAAQEFRSQLGGSTFNQVTLGQAVWLARARDNREELEALAAAAAGLADSEPGGEIWMAGASLLAVDVGRYDEAAERVVDFARRSGGFGGLRPGAHRLPVLGIAAMVAANAAAFEPNSPFTKEDMEEIEAGLASADCAIALVGWPTVVLGPISQFLALVAAVLGRHADAAQALAKHGIRDDDPAALRRQSEEFATLIHRIASNF